MEMNINIRVKIILLHHNGLIRNNGMIKKNQNFHDIYKNNNNRYVVLRKDVCLVYREWKESAHIMHFQTVMNTTAKLVVQTTGTIINIRKPTKIRDQKINRL